MCLFKRQCEGVVLACCGLHNLRINNNEMRIMIIKCSCEKVFEIKGKNHGDRKLCSSCRKANKKRYNREWRQKNQSYNKNYLRKWKMDCEEMERAFV